MEISASQNIWVNGTLVGHFISLVAPTSISVHGKIQSRASGCVDTPQFIGSIDDYRRNPSAFLANATAHYVLM